MHPTNKQIVASGFIVGSSEFEFDPQRPYAGCTLCGEVYQSELDRRVPPGHLPTNSMIAKIAKEKRDEWRATHTFLNHTEKEVRALKESGRFATPEAAQKLATYGIFSITDMVLDNEVAQALREAPRTPENGA